MTAQKHGVPFPSPEVQQAAREAMNRDAAERPARERANRLASARIAVELWGEDALNRPGVSALDRRLMKMILKDNKKGLT